MDNMNTNKMEARIVPMVGSYNSELYLYRNVGDKTMVLNIGERGELLETEVDRGATDAKPFMVARDQEIREFIGAMDEVRIPLGVPEPTKEYAQGKLEATEKHLDDMRTIALKENNK